MDRASDYGSEGSGFKFWLARQKTPEVFAPGVLLCSAKQLTEGCEQVLVGSVPGFIFVEPENYAEGRTEQEGGQYGPYADLTAHEIADYYGGDFHGHPYDADIELGCPLQKQHDAVSGAAPKC